LQWNAQWRLLPPAWEPKNFIDCDTETPVGPLNFHRLLSWIGK